MTILRKHYHPDPQLPMSVLHGLAAYLMLSFLLQRRKIERLRERREGR